MDIDEQLSELIEDPDFLRIGDRFGGFNLFEAMGAVTGELRHSNLLAFLLSPNRPHGLEQPKVSQNRLGIPFLLVM